jgi:hypothetical protein
MMDMKYEALKNGLESLISQMQKLVATGKYDEDEEMDKSDVEGAMGDAEEEMNEGEMPPPPMENPLGDEVKNFMKSKNLGNRPKGLKAIMVEAQVKKPMMGMGFKKGKK